MKLLSLLNWPGLCYGELVVFAKPMALPWAIQNITYKKEASEYCLRYPEQMKGKSSTIFLLFEGQKGALFYIFGTQIKTYNEFIPDLFCLDFGPM